MPMPTHPFRNTESLLVVIPGGGIDVEAEAQLYDELCDDQVSIRPSTRPKSPQGPPSIFSRDIWLNDNSGTSLAFARNVHIAGLGGAYVVYDCVIRTKEVCIDFVLLYDALKHSLPKHQHHFFLLSPRNLPSRATEAAFLDRRRRQLQYWLSAIGACQAVRWWVMD
ncbi:Phox-like protein [Suillus lakei]|nr:Phox-like protein [Suillus lakei]